MNKDSLLVSDVAKLIGRSADRVRQLERDGVLSAERTAGGVRIFRASDVEAYLTRRGRGGGGGGQEAPE